MIVGSSLLVSSSPPSSSSSSSSVPSPLSLTSSSSAISASSTDSVDSGDEPKRGAFIVVEGVDRCGKTTQVGRVLNRMETEGINACGMRFPDRSTATGRIINQYLTGSGGGDDGDFDPLDDDRAIHLLFSANRWEACGTLTRRLSEGKTVLCDRYAYSGVAFSSAKVRQQKQQEQGSVNNKENSETPATTEVPVLSLEWCQAPDKGLPAPDCVIFLDLSQDEAEKRGGYGGERYEKRDMQIRVRQKFRELQKIDEMDGRVPWIVIDASKPMDEVEKDIWSAVTKALNNVQKKDKPMQKMWEDGIYDLPSVP